MRVLVTGDIHADWKSLNRVIRYEQPDLVLQCGDLGFLPHQVVETIRRGPRGEEQCRKSNPFDPRRRLQNVVNGRVVPIRFCEGNHDDIDTLSATSEVANGVVHQPRGSTLLLPDGRTVLFAGGAKSVDWALRDEGVDWFPKETLTEADLDAFPNPQTTTVDIVISHTAPAILGNILPPVPRIGWDLSPDPSRKTLDTIWKRYRPRLWFFGHFHVDGRWERGTTWFVGLNASGLNGMWWTWLPRR